MVKKTLLYISLAIISTAAFADDSSNLYPQSAWYAEVNAGYANSDLNMFGYDFDTGGVGAGANFGYEFNPYVALEAGYGHYFLGNGFNQADIAIKGMIPFGETKRFKLFAKFGPGLLFSNSSLSQSNVNLFAGVGASYRIAPHVEISAQYFADTNVWLTNSMATLGVGYYF